MTKKLRAAGYGRVSTQGQAEKGTQEHQTKDINVECKKLGYDLVKFYSDEGISGKDIKNRPGIQKLMKDAKAGKFDVVIFTKLDRLGRSLRDILNFWNLINEEVGLDLHCIDQPFLNTKGQFGSMMLAILGAFAELERNLIRERTQKGRMNSWKSLKSVMGSVPLGYVQNKEKNAIEIVAKAAEVYKKIVTYYLDENHSVKTIAAALETEGIPTPSGRGKWSGATVLAILKNETYKGEKILNKYVHEAYDGPSGQYYAKSKKKKMKPENEWIKITFPPLISEDRWDQIQAKIEYRKRKPKKRHKNFEDHFLADGFLYCGECGGRIRKRIEKRAGGKFKLEYSCYWKRASAKELAAHGRERCILKPIDEKIIDDEIFGEIVNVITEPSKFAKNWFQDLDVKEVKEQIKNLQEKERQIKNKLEKAFDLLEDIGKGYTRDVFMKRIGEDEAELRSIQNKLRRIEADHSAAMGKADRLKQFENALKKSKGKRGEFDLYFGTQEEFINFLYTLPFDEKKRILEAVVAPENGGKAIVRYPTADDLLENSELAKLSKAERHAPMTGRETIVETSFRLDINRIEAVISGLNKKDLLKGVGFRRIAGVQTECAGGPASTHGGGAGGHFTGHGHRELSCGFYAGGCHEPVPV